MFSIANKKVSIKDPAFIIAEVGINHNGDLQTAMQMIEVAQEAGADAVKFQTFIASEFCGDPNQLFTYKSQGKQVTEPMLKMFQRYEFPSSQWRDLKKHCDYVGITFMSTPQNYTDLELLLGIGIPAVKVGSDDFTNIPLLKSYASKKLPLILSCGMSDLAEVHQALETVGWFEGYQVALLLCTSQYPTPPEDVNIAKLTTLQQAFPGLIVGFSDHTQGSTAAAMAYANGARIFEKHFTLDHNMPGPDHWFSEDPSSLKDWIKTIRAAEKIFGSSFVRPTKIELEMRNLARRSIVAIDNIEIGEVFNSKNIGLRRPGNGIPPYMFENIIGLTASKRIKKGEMISLKDF